MRQFPCGLVVTNIRRGAGARSKNVYAELRDSNGELLISATLDYITAELQRGAFEESV